MGSSGKTILSGNVTRIVLNKCVMFMFVSFLICFFSKSKELGVPGVAQSVKQKAEKRQKGMGVMNPVGL